MRTRTVIIIVFLLLVRPAAALEDPVRTQIFTTPTAETVGQEELRVANTMLLLTQFNYGLTDHLQLGIQNAAIAFLSADLKYRFARHARWQGALLVGGTLNTFSWYDHTIYARLVATYGPTSARVSLGASEVYASSGDEAHREDGFVHNGFMSAELQIAPRVKLLGEANVVVDPERHFRTDRSYWGFGTLGGRFFGAKAAVDVGLLVPFDNDLLGPDLFVVPLFNLSYRFD